ncbi:hypothetical protein BFP97_16130 [Roseivirga sp. 4D4]|uniref:hypothetical protein n=1 Tax=Roseivirga sp. 4D4 TaxID=1889784 RepID=UPI000852BF5C|nr:hypothetical protein [Roseivirga sp. 4D4]OEK02957.1 hypothetical protein BFP97_16130 [Roseivirga sp. 4D4]
MLVNLKNTISSCLIILLTTFSCGSTGDLALGTYTFSGKPNINSKLVLKKNNRFGYAEFNHMISLGTSGEFELIGKKLVLHSDTAETNSSTLEYLESDENSSINLEVISRDNVDNQQTVPATVHVIYKNGRQRTFRCNDKGALKLKNNDLISLEVKWIGYIPVKHSITELKSNNIRVVLVESSKGNTSFHAKKYVIKNNKLQEVSGDKRKLFRVR